MPQLGLNRFNVFEKTPGQAMFGLKTGRVIAVHWQNHTIDVQLSDGSVLEMVHLVEMSAGTDYGQLFAPQLPEDTQNVLEKYGPFPFAPRETFAIIAFVEGFSVLPVCLGFFYPDTSQMMFGNLQYLARYVGDTFAAVSADNGTNWLAFTKDGTGISLNSNDYFPAPDVYENDFDKLSRPGGGIRSITLYLATGSRVHLDGTTSNIYIESETEMDITSKGAMEISGNPLTLSGLTGIYF